MSPRHSEGPVWLRLGEAAEYLGIHPATLRRWSDDGKVSCIRTPGGRRRFAQADLDRFLDSLRDGSHDAPALSGLPLTVLPHSPMVNGSTETSVREQPWYGQIDEDHRALLRGQGQKLMATLMHYLTRDDSGHAYLEEGKRLAAGYAELFLANGLSLTQVVEAFLIVRRSITNSLHEARHGEDAMDAATWRLYDRTQNFLDHALLSMIEVYQQ